jgi:hypothetical protein
MKKLFILSLAMMMAVLINAQNINTDFVHQIDSAGIALKTSSTALGISIVGGVAVGGAMVWYSSELAKEDGNTSVPLVLAGAAGLTSVIAYIVHTVQIGKAGKHLQKANEIYLMGQKQTLMIQQNKDGIGLALKF